MDKVLAIRYIIYKIVEEFKKQKGYTTEQFNQGNNFTLDKCLSLPFIVTIANGKKKEIVTGIFSNTFYPRIKNWDGVVVGDSANENFNLFNANDLRLEFEDNSLIDNFNQNEFQNYDNDVYKQYIDKSINYLLEVRYPDFPLFDTQTLKRIAMENFAFENTVNLYNDGNLTDAELVKKFDFFVVRSTFFLCGDEFFGTGYNWEINNNVVENHTDNQLVKKQNLEK